MTKKDYKMIARVLDQFPFKYITKDDLVNALAFEFEADNSKFDTEKFKAACQSNPRED